MTLSIESQLIESYRDALVGYYLSEVIPNHRPIIESGLHSRIKTANDLYEYLLLDNQVAHEVQSSPVASAIASLQQYINATLMGMEPGYEQLRPDEAQFTEWRDRSSQYPIWAANQQLALYPEIYISPDLRLAKSVYFTRLENDINQNKITLDSVQSAVCAYLSNFEEVANLTVLNGYIDSDKFSEGKYYFIGKSPAEKQYYWRVVDMNERAYVSGTEGPKFDYPTPGAWSDWQKADIGVSTSTLERTIRPVFFNNRLFITWVDLIYTTEEITVNYSLPAGEPPYPVPPTAPESSTIIRGLNVKLMFNISYKKYDNSWSVPQTYMDIITPNRIELDGGKTARVDKDLNTVASYDISNSPESLFIAMYLGASRGADEPTGELTTYALLHTRLIDKNFNIQTCFPSAGSAPNIYSPTDSEPSELRVRKLMWTFGLNNPDRFQFLSDMHIQLKHLETLTPPEWNYGNLQKEISPPLAQIDAAGSAVNFTTYIENKIPSDSYDIEVLVERLNIINLTPMEELMSIKSPYPTHNWEKLGVGSTIKAYDKDWTFSMSLYYSGQLWSIEIKTPDLKPLVIPQNSTDISGNMISRESLLTLKSAAITERSESDWFTNPIDVGLYRASKQGDEVYSQAILLPLNMANPVGFLNPLKESSEEEQIVGPSPLNAALRFNKETLEISTPFVTLNPDNRRVFYIAHGVICTDAAGMEEHLALKLEKLELEYATGESSSPLKAPKIGRRTDPELGTAEFIDFSGSTIASSDSGNSDRSPIRMNTLFARELINKANIALEALLSWGTQHLPEPALSAEAAASYMDFNGANGLYFWELFLHVPFLIAHRLNLERQLSESSFWLGFVFDPARKANSETGAPAYWNVRPLVESSDPDYFMRSPIDPDGIAASHPVRYQKAVYFHYIKNLIDRGDASYRQLTPDSLNEAKLWYVRVLDLLGPRPDGQIISRWVPAKLSDVAASKSSGLRAFELRLQDEGTAPALPTKGSLPSLRLSTFGRDPTLNELDNDYFLPPFNAELIKHWNTLDSRLYNLRHNFTIDGKPLSLSLFATPLDPRAMLTAYASGANDGAAGSLLAQEVPHFRYTVLSARANAAVETLIQFASTLLSMIDRKDQADYQELQQAQVWEFSQFAIDLQEETQRVEKEAKKALQASLAIAQDRVTFYTDLADENVIPKEVSAAAMHMAGRLADGVAGMSASAAAALKVIPNHVGFHAGATGGMACGVAAGAEAGGHRLEGIPEVVAIMSQMVAAESHGIGDALDRSATYDRRLQEWEHARDQASLECDLLNTQLAVHEAQIKVTVIQLEQAKLAKTQAEKMSTFLKNQRFTNAQLYQWLSGQFSMLYYQAYDATLSLCMSAQACWQYEIGDYATSFIQPNAWKDDYKGLTAGETLKLNLLRMDAAYLTRYERRLEIVKTVSVRQLPVSTTEEPTLNQDWETVRARLLDEGIAAFEITQAMLDADYPGHTFRRIKRISVSLPVVLGPYQDIRATLTQTYNAVQIGGVLKENMRASQQIAICTGVDDDGLFVFNFDDERYLPFEGTGVISRWTLSFRNPQSQKEMIESITDIIVHFRYTAKIGGA
ncbi:neuraminidase-like domain-containing protein [Pseudomonas abietaniphila]|uniref:Tc toxin subunit A-related protein n=1 Tax=Pseudomonas abietaniphila TaxID=89065 RepID=UPI003217C60D